MDALAGGADIVVTGRVADASLFAAPLVHEFGWAWDDWDELAAGVVVGHLLECSGQVTGGNYSGALVGEPGSPARRLSDRRGAPAPSDRGDHEASGTGGMVTFDTVREQLLYEVHDPARYLNPDVTADFTSLTLTDHGDNRVQVSGTRGAPPPETYKGLVCTPAGWAGEAGSRTRGPTPKRKHAPRSRSSEGAPSVRTSPWTSGSRSTSA